MTKTDTNSELGTFIHSVKRTASHSGADGYLHYMQTENGVQKVYDWYSDEAPKTGPNANSDKSTKRLKLDTLGETLGKEDLKFKDVPNAVKGKQGIINYRVVESETDDGDTLSRILPSGVEVIPS